MKYLLDTDVFSELVRGRDAALLQTVQAMGTSALAISVVTEGEIRYGQAWRPMLPRIDSRIEALLQELRRLPIGSNVVAPYAALRAYLRRTGTPIGQNDCWIAAHALAENLTLVTGNEREFVRVPGLRIENWLR